MSHLGFGWLGYFISSPFLPLATQNLAFFTLVLKAEKTLQLLPTNTYTHVSAHLHATDACCLLPKLQTKGTLKAHRQEGFGFLGFWGLSAADLPHLVEAK